MKLIEGEVASQAAWLAATWLAGWLAAWLVLHLGMLASIARHLLKHTRTAVTQCGSFFASSRDSQYYNGCDEHRIST